MTAKSRLSFILALLLLFPSAALAEEGWSFRVMPYLWLSGLNGKAAAVPGAPSVDIDMSARDVLEELDFAAFAIGEARKHNFLIRGELAYASISPSGRTPGPAYSGAGVNTRVFQGALTAGYSVARGEGYTVDVFGGARLWVVDNEITLRAGVLPTLSTSHRETFVDPIVGAGVSVDLAPRWSAALSGSIGGFGLAADLEWSVTAGAHYRVRENWGLTFGYRVISVDYRRGGFVYDMVQHGPTVGVIFNF